jgi:hypothetical protein
MTKEPNSAKRWSTTNTAYIGAFVGMVLALAHSAYHVLLGRIPSEDPFLHTFLELMGFTTGAALLFACIAGIRNRLVYAGRF